MNTPIPEIVGNIWLEFSSYSQLIIKGLIIGIIASAPMGPTGILCIRRTMQKGRIYGLLTGAGAAVSDMLYALVTGAGMAFAVNFIEDKQNIFWMKLVGSILLFAFGVFMYRTKPKAAPESQTAVRGNGTYFNNFFTAFLLTLSNPLIIFLFLATFNMFTFVIPNHWLAQAVGYLSIIGGAMLWWGGLTWVIEHMSDRMGPDFALRLNRTIGVIVLIISIFYAANTLFNISLPLLHN